jgi:hypothetical protein
MAPSSLATTQTQLLVVKLGNQQDHNSKAAGGSAALKTEGMETQTWCHPW